MKSRQLRRRPGIITMNNEQRGVALLIVLMLLALMAALAADMTISFHGQLHRTRQVN